MTRYWKNASEVLEKSWNFFVTRREGTVYTEVKLKEFALKTDEKRQLVILKQLFVSDGQSGHNPVKSVC